MEKSFTAQTVLCCHTQAERHTGPTNFSAKKMFKARGNGDPNTNSSVMHER